MGIPIDWEPTTASLHNIHHHLTNPGNDWPEPRVDVPPITAEQRRRARRQWANRVRATYISTGQAASLCQQLIALGAPVEILSGAAYTAEELTLQLTANLHLLRPLQPPSSLTAPEELAPRSPDSPCWEVLFEQAVEFFAFNLALSQPVYRALYAVSSDPAFSELSAMLADNLAELTTFGDLAIKWIRSAHISSLPSSLSEKLPLLFAAYESLLHGGPDRLDAMAGEEITVDTRPGNLGTLSSQQLAAVFYDTLQNKILPDLEELGLDAFDAWRRRHRTSERISPPPPAVVAGVGIELHGSDRHPHSTPPK